MFIRTLHVLSLAMLLLYGAVANAANPSNAEYKLGAGDVIGINVYGESDLSIKSLRLTDAGTFSYPFVGEIQARGHTAAEIEQLLVDKLKEGYLVNPRVSVSLIEYRAFFIGGEVKTPGGYPFQPGLTLRRAVALAGGFTERASESKVTIVRDSSTDKVPEKASLDALIKPGDTITVAQGFF
jgi:polysaccharide export outer membrane protein